MTKDEAELKMVNARLTSELNQSVETQSRMIDIMKNQKEEIDSLRADNKRLNALVIDLSEALMAKEKE